MKIVFLRAVVLLGASLLCQCSGSGDRGVAEKAKQAESIARGLYEFDAKNVLHPDFSGANALAHVQAQVDFGPRPSGSENLEKCRVYLEKTLLASGWEVQRQSFEDYTPKGNIKFHNVRARFPMKDSETWKRSTAALICSHYDTKLFSGFNFVGANDAGSSTGVLLEMARVLAKNPKVAQFVELVFFDGEEAVVEYTMDPRTRLPKDGLYGSRYYVDQLKKLPPDQLPLTMILLDMVGEKNLQIRIPADCPAPLTQGLLASAKELGYGDHFGQSASSIVDDHLPFLVARIPAIDIIDLDYPTWHTQGDTVDKLSPESLEMSGRATLLFLEKYVLGGH
jgi:glutaminyl-peptide cyclotransferase